MGEMLDAPGMRPASRKHLKDVTLCCIDTTDKQVEAWRAVIESSKQAHFAKTVFITHDTTRPNAVHIPRLNGLEDYSRFVLRDLWRHIPTSHCLLIQADGYVLNGKAWDSKFLDYDYIGAPWQPSGTVGNGGFSLRSRKLLAATHLGRWPDYHPEDAAICLNHREELESKGIKFAPQDVAARFSYEGRSWDGREWRGVPNEWAGSFGFHSWLTRLPDSIDRPKIFHHSGDAGDVVYALAAMRALGGGVLFLSTDNKYPYPKNSRWAREGGHPSWVDNLRPFLEHQDYVWKASFTHGVPPSTDYDLNKFREPWQRPGPDNFANIFTLHQKPYQKFWPEDKPWLTVKEPFDGSSYPIAVHCSPRYRNDKFPWEKLVERYGDQMSIVGTQEEAHLFQGFRPTKKVLWTPTNNALALARVIAGSKCCIMNQSLPLAIAHGLGKKVLVEEWPLNRNCHLNRPGAIYENRDTLPDDWL